MKTAFIGNPTNYFFNVSPSGGNTIVKGSVAKDLRYSAITPIIFTREKQDIQKWRDAVVEIEAGMIQFKQRVKAQRLFLDTVLNDHVTACMKRRRSLVTKKGFDFVNMDGSINKQVTEMLTKKWFYKIIEARQDAIFYGYSLLNYSDVVNNDLFSRDPFGNLAPIKTIPRMFVSPDRLNVVNIPYAVVGIPFRDRSYKDENGFCPYDWSFWFPTPSEEGISECGYGLLYKIAKLEIYLRNLAGQEATFMELYGSPTRVGKTNKLSDERDKFFQDLYEMGASSTIVIDPTDEVELLDSRNVGTGWKSWENYQQRREKGITKLVFGHEDVMSSTPGKLGANDESMKALKETESDDCFGTTDDINMEVLPKLRNLGLPIPEGVKFKIRNIEELEEFRTREDASNKVTAEIAKTMKEAGLKMDAVYFTERTKIPATEIVEPTPDENIDDEGPNVMKKLKNIYKS